MLPMQGPTCPAEYAKPRERDLLLAGTQLQQNADGQSASRGQLQPWATRSTQRRCAQRQCPAEIACTTLCNAHCSFSEARLLVNKLGAGCTSPLTLRRGC